MNERVVVRKNVNFEAQLQAMEEPLHLKHGQRHACYLRQQ